MKPGMLIKQLIVAAITLALVFFFIFQKSCCTSCRGPHGTKYRSSHYGKPIKKSLKKKRRTTRRRRR